jgi:Xaa-Pro dipeptidase
MSERIKEFQKTLQKKELDAYLVTNTTNVYYFTNFFSRSAAYLEIFPGSTPHLYVPELEYEEALSRAKFCEISKVEKQSDVFQEIKKDLETVQVKKLGIEETSMNVKTYQDLVQKYNFPKLENGSDLIDELRKIKYKDEIDKIKKACQMADNGIAKAMEAIEEGKAEVQVAGEVEYAMRKAGSESIPFDTIIASGYRSAFPHGTSSDKKIKQGDLIIIDLGAKYGGYASDITRTVVLGAPSTRQQELFDTVLNVQQSAIKACLVGEKAMDIEEQVRKTLTERKYEEYFVHSLGHGVGLDVHELPYVSVKSKDVLVENNVFTIEPGVYIPDFGGVRIEDTLVLKKEGPKILTRAKYTFEI